MQNLSFLTKKLKVFCEKLKHFGFKTQPCGSDPLQATTKKMLKRQAWVINSYYKSLVNLSSLIHGWFTVHYVPCPGIANLIVGVVGAFNLHLHMSFKHDRLHQNYSERSLKIIERSSLCLGTLALLAALTFFILAGVLKRFIHPIGRSNWILRLKRNTNYSWFYILF